jgi:hypothetical protein
VTYDDANWSYNKYDAYTYTGDVHGYDAYFYYYDGDNFVGYADPAFDWYAYYEYNGWY